MNLPNLYNVITQTVFILFQGNETFFESHEDGNHVYLFLSSLCRNHAYQRARTNFVLFVQIWFVLTFFYVIIVKLTCTCLSSYFFFFCLRNLKDRHVDVISSIGSVCITRPTYFEQSTSQARSDLLPTITVLHSKLKCENFDEKRCTSTQNRVLQAMS